MNTFKAATEKGKERKRRVVASILYQPTRYDLLVSFYKTVLPLFKGYVLVFQSDTPIIHKVYYKQVSLVKEFYSYFVNPSVLEKCKTAKEKRMQIRVNYRHERQKESRNHMSII